MTDLNPDWINAFADVFSRCAIKRDEKLVIFSETSSSAQLIEIARQAFGQLSLSPTMIVVQTPSEPRGPIIKSSGASQALTGQAFAISALKSADVIIDLSVEGLMHAKETPEILQSGARIMNISHEHPEVLARLVPSDEDKDQVKEAVARLRATKKMTVTSPHGSELTVDMGGAATVGVWGWTDRPGTLAHWPGGLVVSFPQAGAVNGKLVMAPGDINLTFKRYIETPVEMLLENDYITKINGQGVDAVLMRDYLASFGDKEAYATSHVGWGLNERARYEALTMYDKSQTNGTELRAVAGNFLYSTGANEFAGRFTRGHFDLPMMGCDIALDGVVVVEGGKLK